MLTLFLAKEALFYVTTNAFMKLVSSVKTWILTHIKLLIRSYRRTLMNHIIQDKVINIL